MKTLFRTFFAQFFTSESVTSDIQLRQTIFSIFAFLLPPGLFLVIQIFPAYQVVVIRAAKLNSPACYGRSCRRCGLSDV